MKADELVVRAASTEDYEPACVLLDGLDELHRQRLPWLFRAPDQQPRSREYFAQLLADDNSSVLLAQTTEIVGVAIILMRSMPDFAVFVPQRCGVIDSIVVAEGQRQRGVGRRLAQAAEAWATARGAQWLELGFYEFNAGARSFYEALGYLPLSTKLRKVLPGPA